MQTPIFKSGIVDRQIGHSFHGWKKSSRLHHQLFRKLDNLLLFRFLNAFYRSLLRFCAFPKFPIRRTCPRSHQIAGCKIGIGGGSGISNHCFNAIIIIIIVIVIGSRVRAHCFDILIAIGGGKGCVYRERLCVFKALR